MSCICTLEVSVPLCTETLNIPSFLDDGMYNVVITDKFGNKHERNVASAYGFMQVDLTDYKSGLFTAFSNVNLTILDGCESQQIGDCDVEYKELIISFHESDTNETEYTLCCNQ